jgi:hypothetical protein
VSVSLFVDFFARSIERGQARERFLQSLLRSISKSARSFFDHYYAYSGRLVISNQRAFDVCPPAFRQFRKLVLRLFVLPYLRSLSLLQQATLSASCFHFAPSLSILTPRLLAPTSTENIGKDLTIRPSLYKHMFVHLRAQVSSAVDN